MAKRIVFLYTLCWLPFWSIAQMTKLSQEKQQLLLQLSLNFYTVAKEGLVDQDSSLLIASKKNHLSRWPVITDGFGNDVAISNTQWIDKRDTKAATSKLAALHGIDRVKLLLLLGAYYAFQPGYHQKDRDSAQYFLSQAKEESEAYHATMLLNQSLCLLAKNNFKGNRVKEGIDCFNTLIESCQKTGDKAMEAKAWDYQGSYIPPAANTIMLKINSIQKANELYQQLNQPAKQINALMNLGYLGFLTKDINGAEKHTLKVVQLQDSINFPYKHYSYDLLALIYGIKGDIDIQLNYALKEVKTALATNDKLGLAWFYARVGTIAYGGKTTTFPFAIYWNQKAVAEFTNNRDPSVYKALINLADCYHATGRFKEAADLLEKTLKKIPPINPLDRQLAYIALADNYKGIKQYEMAEKYYFDAYALLKQDRSVTAIQHLAFLEYNIGQLYMEMESYEKAKDFLQKYLANPGADQLLVSQGKTIVAHRLLFQIDSIQRNYISAVKHLEQYVISDKALRDRNDSKAIASMKITYEMAQKEKDMEILQAKNALQNQQANAIRKFIYIGLVIALLAIALLYYRYHINRKQRQFMDKKNRELQHVIGEKDELLVSKEWLLKEVHHRVKNNLHTVICLLESQAAYLENDALKAIENSQHRIYAMSLIHQKLYQSEDIKTVDMSAYLPEFMGYLNESIGIGNQVHFELAIEPLKLGVSYAVPLSLIINEAVTNAIKYAFPNGRKGIIKITMNKKEQHVQLVIADNGIGISTDQINSSSSSLGLKLLKGLTEDIQGTLAIISDNGTTISIAFDIDPLMEPIVPEAGINQVKL